MSFLAAAGLSALGGIVSSAIGSHSAKSVSKQNYESSREAMQNKHQWEVEDLKKAGLNPILSAHGSTGTTSGSGVSFTPSNPFEQLPSLFIAKKQAEANINSANANANNLNADAKLKGLEYIRQRSAFYDFLQQQSTNTAISMQNLENARKQGLLLDASIQEKQSNTAVLDASRNREKAELPFWQIAGETAKGIKDSWDNYWKEDYQLRKEYNAWFKKHYGFEPFDYR